VLRKKCRLKVSDIMLLRVETIENWKVLHHRNLKIVTPYKTVLDSFRQVG
jgi:hypothetical protein